MRRWCATARRAGRSRATWWSAAAATGGSPCCCPSTPSSWSRATTCRSTNWCGVIAASRARRGERLQGAAHRPRPASSAVPEVPSQPGLLHLRPDRADAAPRGAVPTAAGPRPASRPAAPDPLPGARCRKAGTQRTALAARLRAQQLPARLALSRRRPTRIAKPGVDPSIPGRNRQAWSRTLVRRTAKHPVRPVNLPNLTVRRKQSHQFPIAPTENPPSEHQSLPCSAPIRGIKAFLMISDSLLGRDVLAGFRNPKTIANLGGFWYSSSRNDQLGEVTL